MATATQRSTTLEQWIEVSERFHRSVHLGRDWEQKAGIENYIVTPTARQLSKRIFTELGEENGTRAWSLVGPYGAGKSAFALFLTHLLCADDCRREEMESIRKDVSFDGLEFLPVLLVADRSPLEERIASEVARAFEGIDDSVVDEGRALASEDEIRAENLCALLDQASFAAEEAGHSGILLAVDEFGKYLEYAAAKPEERDLLFLQELAEYAARSDFPFLFLTILHQGFTDYLPNRDELHRREWQKVQGRFREVAFQLPVEQLLALVGQAIKADLPERLEAAWQEQVAEATDSEALERVKKRVPVEEVLPDTVPVNPVAALLMWPTFRSKMAQNERSLFAFLTSGEPFGFPDYLAVTEYDGTTTPPMYTVDRLYDYVDNALTLGAFRGEQGRRWAEIQHCLGRVPANADETAKRVVKAIGLLSMYGPQIGLAASAVTLIHALPDSAEAVEATLETLEERSIAIFREHENAYGLWEGSDVDLREAYEKACREVGQAGLAERLEKHVDLQPVVARAHYVQSGTLRYLDVGLVDAEPDELEAVFEQETVADGRVVFMVGVSDDDREQVRSAAEEVTEGKEARQLRLVALPDGVTRLNEALQELEAWRWVRDNVTKLQGDDAARQEVKARISHAREVVDEKAGEVFGLAGHSFRPELSEWVQGGKPQPRRSGRAFQRWISELCDQVYHKAPVLHNELLNRQSLSSASSAARRNLIEAMLDRPEEERLGIEGTPAEASMYASMLKAGGFHQMVDEHWKFTEPYEEWSGVWSFLDEYFEQTARQRQVVSDFFEQLQRAPFGLRQGLLPVLFLAYVQANSEEIAFYEDGVYVPEVTIEVIERLLARPETFEIQSYELAEEQKRVLDALADKVVSPHTGEHLEAELLPIVRSLVRQAADLNDFTRQTNNLEPQEAVEVRDRLLEATSPLDLLFEDLPDALDVILEGPEDVDEFAERLRDCMVAIHRAYPALLDRIETALRNAFGLPEGPAVAAVSSLKRRAQPLKDYALENTLQVFVREAARLGNQRDWREVLGRVVQGGMPPASWSDKDVEVFQVRLSQIAGSFNRLEELVAEREGTAAARVYRLGVLRDRFEERRAVVAVDEEIESEVEELATALLHRMSEQAGKNGDGRRVRVAALAQVSESLLASEVEEEG